MLSPRWPLLRCAVFVTAIACALTTDAADSKSASTKSIPADQVAGWIDDLGDASYFVREEAQRRLAQAGAAAFDQLQDASEDLDIEIASRAQYILAMISIDWTNDKDPVEVRSLLKNFGDHPEEERLQTIAKLGELPDHSGAAALCRVVRYDRSSIVSKQAALALFVGKSAREIEDSQWQALASTIDSEIAGSKRTAADWARAYVDSRNVDAQAGSPWAAFAESESRLLEYRPNETDLDVVMFLWRQEVAELQAMEKPREAAAAMMRLVSLQPGDTEGLVKLVHWLVEQQAWPVIDQVAARFDERFRTEAQLAYTLAQARRAQGDERRSTQLATAALGLNAGNQIQHLIMGMLLQERGMFDWAEREYTLVINIGPGAHQHTLRGRLYLANMYYDQGRALDAAKIMEDAVVHIERNVAAGNPSENLEHTPKTAKAAAQYYFAVHAEQEGDAAERRQHLLQAFELDPANVDVLIALFNTPDVDDAVRQRNRAEIKKQCDLFRNAIRQDPDDAMPYNQLAWLIANTEGDQQEALQASQKSLELRPEEGGYLDTLARCYYAIGDTASAVKHQTRAVELEPFSGQMQRQLKLFQDAMAAASQP